MAAVTESCENCKYFLQIESSTGKGMCRIDPPRATDSDGDSPTREDVRGRRWPVCWGSEWCGKWTKK